MSKWNQLYREVEILGYQYLRNCAQPLINLEVLAPFLRHIIFSCFPSLVLGSYWGKTPNRPDPYTTILGNKRMDGKGDKRIIPLINRCATCGWKDRSFSNDSALMGPSSLNFGQNFYKSISWDSSFKTQEYLYSVLYSFFSVAPKSQHLAVVTTILHLLLPVCVRSYLYV